jgi:TetR/AcrR family transcriptional repressor of nem operon
MARPRTFDPEKVLDIALDAFWRKGFHGTSLDDITDESGLAKPSLYAAFGDKVSLYLKVLDRYHSWVIKDAQRILSHGPSAREAVEAWLVSFVPRASGAKGKRGCLSLNTATDATLDQAELRNRVARFNSRLEDLIRARLEADRTQFSKSFDPAAAAQAIVTIHSGLMVLAKQAPSPERVRAVISQVTKLLA